MKKKIGSVCLVLSLLLCMITITASASGLSRETRNSIVEVVENIVVNGEYVGSWAGTGFFVGEKGENPEYLVTNCHVIELFLAAGGGGSESSLYAIFGSDDVVEAYVVDYDVEKDLALLRLDKPTDLRQPLKLKVPTQDDVGSGVFTLGFPGAANGANPTDSYDVESATVTSGVIGRLFTEKGTGRRLIQMDASILGGNSGGPLVNQAECVIGVNTFHLVDENDVKLEGLNYAVSVAELIPMLERNGVRCVIVADEPETEPINPVLIVGVGLVLVLAVFVVCRVVLSRKKKPAPAPQPEKKSPILCSLSSQHGGMKMSLAGRQVLIGRDASSCQVVFGNGTPGVSGRHCAVAWDETRNQFVLTDLQSTYGTFLMGGQKLAPGVPCYLKQGDSFYVGDKANMFRLELG